MRSNSGKAGRDKIHVSFKGLVFRGGVGDVKVGLERNKLREGFHGRAKCTVYSFGGRFGVSPVKGMEVQLEGVGMGFKGGDGSKGFEKFLFKFFNVRKVD